jgi:sugar lactone lactonase YvrE
MHPSRLLATLAATLALALTFAPRTLAQSYTWTTFAGSRPLYGSADGAGSQARFNVPLGVVVDPSGNTFVADTENNTIRKITPAGVVTTIGGLAGVPGASDGNATTSRFNAPNGLALDNQGNLYVADSGNHTIRLILPTGLIATFAGRTGVAGSDDGPSSLATFNTPSGLTFDIGGNLVVSDSGNHTLRKISASGAVTTFVGSAGLAGTTDATGTAARFNTPIGLTHDVTGNIFVADSASHTLRKINVVGTVTTVAGGAGLPGAVNGTGASARFNTPYGVLSDATGNILVTDRANNCIRLVTTAGVVSTYLGRLVGGDGYVDGAASGARLFRPAGIAFSPDNSIIFADSQNLSIRRLSPSDDLSTLAGPGGNFGRVDGAGNNARFNFPQGLALTTAGELYVADSGSGSLRRISTLGSVQTIAGGSAQGYNDGAAGVNLLNYPSGIALAADGTVFFAEGIAHSVRALLPNGTVVTVAGTGGQSGNTDATGFAARFNSPSDVALDPQGNLYVADTANHVIRRIDLRTTAVTTFAGAAGSPGTADGQGTAARFNSPRGLCADTAGNLYVSDYGSHTIRRISNTGLVTTFAGAAGVSGSSDGTLANARFTQPAGLTIDRSGRIFVADSGSHSVRLISGTLVTTIGGLGGVGGYADGPTSTARFFLPSAVAVDLFGNIYVAEAGNNLIVKGTLDTPSVAGRLINLSILSSIETAADTFTLGYVVGGNGSSGNKPLVIRAAGPALGAFGVPGTIADPKFDLYAGSEKVGGNDNWGGSASVTAAMANVGAFPYATANSKDAAVVAQIKTRDNSVVVASSDGSTGAVIAEVYDATTAASFATITPRLLNVSVRKNLGTGLTAGFVLGGSTPTKVLIRAVGPSLAAFGVPGTVADPQFILYKGSSKIGENNDWGGTAELSAAFTSVGAFNFTNAGSKDAALVITLQPGDYSVAVSGVNNTTGVALVEVYEVP